MCITGSHVDETHGSGGGRQSSSRPCWTHRHTQDTHTQQSTVTTTTTTTKSRGGQQRPSSSLSSLSWLRQERNKKGEIQAKPRNVAWLVGRSHRSPPLRQHKQQHLFVLGISGWPKKSTAHQIKQGVYPEAQPAHTHTQTRADWRATLRTRAINPTVVRASRGAMESNTTTTSNNIHLPENVDNAQLRASVGQLKRTVESQADNVNSLRKTVY